jgi:hypothetical protein
MESCLSINYLKDRFVNRIQLTTEGHKVYANAVDNAFGSEIDYAILNKLYGQEPEQEKRYSPAKCIGPEIRILKGSPDPELISTSFVERQNLTMRMSFFKLTHYLKFEEFDKFNKPCYLCIIN